MPREKLVNRPEAIAWLAEGHTYNECVRLHEAKYHVRTSPGLWAKLRSQAGLPRRIVRDENLIPWAVKTEHRWAYPLVMLRFEAKRRASKELLPNEQGKLDPFLARLAELNLVVHYDKDTAEGFFLVPREPFDTDIIRKPSTGLSQRRARD